MREFSENKVTAKHGGLERPDTLLLDVEESDMMIRANHDRLRGGCAGFVLMLLAILLLNPARFNAQANEVPAPIYSFDVGGGQLFPETTTTAALAVDVHFDPSATLPMAAVPWRFYRAVWEFNVPYGKHVPNPELLVSACDGSRLADLGVPPSLVVGSGPNGVLETDPDLADILSDPPGQLPEIHTGNDLVPDTRVAQNIVIKPGRNGILQSSPSGDDVLGTDTNPASLSYRKSVILAGPNGIAESYAFPGILIRAGTSGVIGAIPLGDDIYAPGGDPETGGDVIFDGRNEVCETRANTTVASDIQFVGLGVRPSDDVQVASPGADVGLTNIVISAGPNGVLDTVLPVPPGGNDDHYATDVNGARCITVGANRYANTRATGDDIQVLEIGEYVPDSIKLSTAPSNQACCFVVTAGPNNILETAPAGDDILTTDTHGNPIIVVGPNLIAETRARIPYPFYDIQVLPVGASVPAYLVPDDSPTYMYGWRFTDDIQVNDPDGFVNNSNPGIDTGYVTLAEAKAMQCVQYSWAQMQPYNEVYQQVAVRLRFYIALDADGTGAVESTFTRELLLSMPNYQSVVDVSLGASQGDTIQPGTGVDVDIAQSLDQDGYPLWGAIDWGDGNRTLLTLAQLAQLPELLGDLSHPAGGYANSGIYRVTVSIIDNGRLPLAARFGFAAFQASRGHAGATDPRVVLADAIAYQIANPPPYTILNSDPPGTMLDGAILDLLGNRIDPILMQDLIFIRVLGGFSARSGRLSTMLDVVGRDGLTLGTQATENLTFMPGDTVTVALSHPNTGASTQIGSGPLSANGSFVDRATGLRFRYDQKTRQMMFRLNRSDLKAFFEIFKQSGGPASSSAQTIQNGYAEVAVTITGLTGATPLGIVRFVYNSNTKRGKGTLPKSVNDPG